VRRIRPHLTYANVMAKLTYSNVVSTLCLFLILGGVAWAATNLPERSVGPTQLRKNAVRSWKVKNHTLKRIDLAPGVLPSGSGEGFTDIHYYGTFNQTSGTTAQAECPPQQKVVGGGGLLNFRAGALSASIPFGDNNSGNEGWFVQAAGKDDLPRGAISVAVLCAS
jgi:hypothetical protein